MTLNFPDTPSTGDIYTDSTSGFSYEWNGTVWISTDPARAANIKELDDISSSFNGSTTTFNLTVSSAGVSPVTAQQLLISVGGVMQNPSDDFTVSGTTITFTTAPSNGLTFFGVLLGQALSLNTIADGTVTISSLKAGTAGVGIQSAGAAIGVGITQLNFIGAGNTFAVDGNKVDVSIAGGGGGGIGTVVTFEDASDSPFSYINPEYILEKNITFDTTNAGAGYSSIVVSTIPTITVKSGVGMTVGVGKTLVIDVLQIGDL
tara:strand:- start:327 stop:1109 length:783 start_codon:yes stop_codon:yes gene_type:complete